MHVIPCTTKTRRSMSTCLMSFLTFTCLLSAQQIVALYVNLPHVLCCPSCTSLITLCRVCPYPLSLVVIRILHTTLRYACVDVFTNFWSVVYIFSSKKTTYHFGGAHDDRLLLAIHASCQDGVRTLPPISKRFCIVRVILHTSLILYTSLRYANSFFFLGMWTNGLSTTSRLT